MATIPGYVKEVRRKTPAAGRRSANANGLSPVAALVRRHDRDRFQTALFAPAARREALFALYAFNYEIARVRESVTQPVLGQVRLQWWRENVTAAFTGGPVRHNPVVEALAAAIQGLTLTREHFDRMIDARETDLSDEPPPSLPALEDYGEATSTRLIYLALETLGVHDTAAREAANHIGIAYALAGLLRAMPYYAWTGRRIIPTDLVLRTGLAQEDYRELRDSPALRGATAEIAAVASRHLAAARILRGGIPRPALPALLPAIVAGRSLARLKSADYNAFDRTLVAADPLQSWRLAVAALLGRF
jgi:NADH dehydrogenase [ubiquinone] 1 alpha subcomplex assembly factor 6